MTLIIQSVCLVIAGLVLLLAHRVYNLSKAALLTSSEVQIAPKAEAIVASYIDELFNDSNGHKSIDAKIEACAGIVAEKVRSQNHSLDDEIYVLDMPAKKSKRKPKILCAATYEKYKKSNLADSFPV